MENEFKHNFCESRLQDYQPPEIWNAYTSLVISAFPFIIGFPKSSMFYNIACMLSINGFASFYYHYYLNWYGETRRRNYNDSIELLWHMGIITNVLFL